MAHEVSHIVLRHPQRGKAFLDRGFFRQVGVSKIKYCPKVWNRAADYVINADLVKHGLEFIPEGLLDSSIDRNELVDDVYMQLVNDSDDQPNSSDNSAKDNSNEDQDDNSSGNSTGNGNGHSDDGGDQGQQSASQGDNVWRSRQRQQRPD